jgi:hypothetical protein
MNVRSISYGTLLFAALVASFSAKAELMAPVPTNAYIVLNGLDWAWAQPLPAGNGLDLSYQSQFGWAIPTATQLQNAPLATDFLFANANVPFNGVDPISQSVFQATNAAYTGAGACAASYFGSFTHCDWQDGNGQPFGPWAGIPGAASFADQLVVREDIASAVPEPSTWIMMILGFCGLGSMTYRRNATSLRLA